MKTKYDCIIVGAGPAGIFTAIELTRLNGNLKVLIIDKGRSIEKRTCPARNTGECIGCNPCGIVFGWSGARLKAEG